MFDIFKIRFFNSSSCDESLKIEQVTGNGTHISITVILVYPQDQQNHEHKMYPIPFEAI